MMLDFVRVLRWDQSQHPRDKDGKFTEIVGEVRGEVRTTSEQARRDILALGKNIERHERRHARAADTARAAYETWWAALSRGRKKPLKPDGAAAKKLPEWKAAQEADAEVMRIAGEARTARRLANEEALRQLLVPEGERSKVKFLVPKGQLHPEPRVEEGIGNSASRALDNFRKYDGSGELMGTSFPVEKIEELKPILGPHVTFDISPDGKTARIATKLRLTKAPPGQRANASPFGVQLQGTRELDRVVNHEVAHHIEFHNRKIYDAAVALRSTLATSQTPIKLNDLKNVSGYGDDEVALPGRFVEPYDGKVYPSETQATEMISRGVEMYLGDPITFAQKAPEHFRLIWDVMHGRYRETD